MRSKNIRWLTGGALALALFQLVGTAGTLLGSTTAARAQEAGSAYVDYLVVKSEELLNGKARDPAAAAQLLREAVYVGSVPAMLTLAGLYATGDGVEANFAEAKTLIEAAMAGGAGASGWIALGDLYRDTVGPERNAAAAVDAYQSAVDLGSTSAMLRLARVVGSGDGVPVDFERARIAFERAIAVGDETAATAWGNLGDLYRNAEGDDRQPAKAVDAYVNALDLGNTGVLVVLARLVGSGDGVPADFERARGYLEQAIAQGDSSTPWAMATLGDLYRNADAANRDPGKAIEFYKSALAAGYTDVLVGLAGMIGAGDGTRTDFVQARAYLEQAIALDNATTAWAYATLGDLYRDAAEVNRDLAKAVEAYQNAVDRGAVGQLVKLARMVGLGEGVPAPDFDRARALLERAVVEDESNAAWAYSSLGDLYRDAEEPNRDLASAVDAYRHASDLNDGSAMLKLARLLASGEGVPADFDGARQVLEKAISLNDASKPWAFAMLGDLYRNAEPPNRDPAKAVDALRNALELGNTDVLIVLARMIGSGDGVATPEFEKAREYLEQAIALGGGSTAWAYASLGDLYRNATGWRRNPAKAVAAYEEARALGDTSVLVSLAKLIGAGDGVERDFETARVYLEEAIALGGPGLGWAYAALGDLYRDADETNRDIGLAGIAYQDASDLGDTDSMLKLARIYTDGDGVAPDFDRARGLLAQVVAAADHNEIAGWTRLGDLFRDAGDANRDPAAAVDAYRHAADLGDTAAMIRIAGIVGAGDGVPVDFAEARGLYEEAIAVADANAVWAWTGLADLYRNAEATHRDSAKAVAGYRKAIELGNPDAMIVLATMVAVGDGAPADPDEAKSLLERAAVAGGQSSVNAWIALGAMHRDPVSRHYNLASALDYYRRAADAGSGQAHLVAAELEAAQGITTGEQRLELVRHYQEAARLSGPEEVARAMYRLDPTTLYATVQELLSKVDRPISADGIFGKQMQAAIDRFCAANALKSCGNGLVSFELLMGLVSVKTPSA